MNLAQFEDLYNLETMIREYQGDLETLERFEDKSAENILDFSIKLRSPFNLEGRLKSEILSEFNIYGSGSADKEAPNYALNARIMAAAIKAMRAEMQAITLELTQERDNKIESL